MTESPQFAARLISAGAAGYAAAAANRLLEEQPDTARRFGSGAFAAWQAHLKQRLDELAAALLAGEPQLLASEVAWSAAAFRAREVPDSDLRLSLECLGAVLEEELPAQAGEQPRRYLELSLAALEAAAPEPATPAALEPATHRLGLAYMEAVISGERRKAIDAVIAAVDGGLALPAAFEALMFAQQQVGEMWHAQELGVAQEHFATETTRQLLALLVERGATGEANGKTVVVAMAPGNSHDMGARVVAAFFEMEGWRTIHLADPLPPDDLVLGIEVFEPDLLALSMSMSPQLGATMALVARLRAARPELKILVGGRSLVQSPELGERIGADGSGDRPADALRLGRELVGLPPKSA